MFILQKMQLLHFKKQLKKHKKSFTSERKQIFLLAQKMQHFSAQELFEALKEKSKISRMSVFRTVQLFEQIGVLRKVITNSNAVRYELNTEENHHEHMQCSVCGQIIEFPDNSLHNQLEKIAEKHDFKIQEHSLFLRGLCKKCNH